MLPYYWHLIYLYIYILFCLMIWHLIYFIFISCFALLLALDIPYIHILCCLIIWHLIFFIFMSCFALSLALDILLSLYLVLPYHMTLDILYNRILLCLIIGTWYSLYSYLVLPYAGTWYFFIIIISCSALLFGTWYTL